MSNMIIECDMTYQHHVGCIIFKLRDQFLLVTALKAKHRLGTWHGEVGYASAGACRTLALKLKAWLRLQPRNKDNQLAPFKVELPVLRYGEAYRDGENGELEVEINNDAESITILVEIPSEGRYLKTILLEMAEQVDKARYARRH